MAYTGPVLARLGMFFRQWSAFPPNPWISTIGGPSLPCVRGSGGGQGGLLLERVGEREDGSS